VDELRYGGIWVERRRRRGCRFVRHSTVSFLFVWQKQQQTLPCLFLLGENAALELGLLAETTSDQGASQPASPRELGLEFNIRKTEFDFGIRFLTRLVQVHATINCYGSTAASVEAVEAALRDQVSQNPVLKITTIGLSLTTSTMCPRHRDGMVSTSLSICFLPHSTTAYFN
jgi:hypothetical protein